jgi:hygromycin-B 7''-O-kinase
VTLPEVKTYSDLIEIEPLLQDVDFWMPLLRRICDRESISFSTITAGFPSSSASFILDKRLVVKISAPINKETCQVETDLLALLSDEPEIPSPGLEASGTIPGYEDWPYVIMERIPGVEIREIMGEIEPDNLIEIASQFGAILKRLHSIDTSVVNSVPDWEAKKRSFSSVMRNSLATMRNEGSLSDPLLEELDAFYLKALDEYGDSEKVLTHCDLTEDHLFLASSGGRWKITGLIDYQNAHVGPKEFDWQDTWSCLWETRPQLMRSFLSGYGLGFPLDEEFARRCLFLGSVFTNPRGLLKNAGASARTTRSLDELLHLIWPSELMNG